MATWLNLRRDYRVPRDVRRLIYAKLDKCNKEFVKRAHNSKYLIVLMDEHVEECAKKGHLSLIQWIAVANGLTFYNANGFTVLNCHWHVAHGAADGGSLPILQWFYEQRWNWPMDTIFWIVRSGRLDILQWFVKNVPLFN